MESQKLITEYLDYLENERGVSRYTLKDYDYYLRRFLNFLAEEKLINLNKISHETIERYKQSLTGEFKNSTQNYFLIALRNFVLFLNIHKSFSPINYMDITLVKHPKAKVSTLSKETLEKLLAAPDQSNPSGLRDKTIIELISRTGLKISETTSLNRSSLDYARGVIEVKSKKSRFIDIPEGLVDILSAYLKSRKDSFEPLFIRMKGEVEAENHGEKMRLSDRSVERMFKKYAQVLGIKDDITPKLLRHSFAKDLLDQGEQLVTVQKALGHINKASTKVYQRA